MENEKERKAQSAKDKRVATIHVINNGFILRTRSGTYVYSDFESLSRALREYLELIQREIDSHEKEIE